MKKVIRCSSCPKRHRGQSGWNVEYVAGIEVGHLCPDCQTPQQDLEAELELILGRSQVGRELRVTGPQDLTHEVLETIYDTLVSTYPTSKVMRDKADRLARARGDRFWMVGIMRSVADDLPSGDLSEHPDLA